MKADRTLRPFRTFFAAGQYGRGSFVLILQLSLIFWPFAIRMARRFDEARGVQRLLNEFSLHYQVQGNGRNQPKRFRETELVSG